MDNILDAINSNKDILPVKQRKLGDFILKNSREVYLMTVGELSARAGVGRATVMRFMGSFNYANFAVFKKDLNTACIEHFSDKDMDQPFVWPSYPDNSDQISNCFTEAIDLIGTTLKDLDRTQFDMIIDLILDAQRVNVIGLRTSSSLSKHFAYHLEPLINNVRDLGDNESLAYDRILRFEASDLLIIIAAVPITNTIMKIAQLCQQQKVPVALITDSKKSPVIPYAKAYIHTPTNISKRWSVLPFIAVFEAIFSAIGLKTAPFSVRTLNKRDKYLLDNKICTY